MVGRNLLVCVCGYQHTKLRSGQAVRGRASMKLKLNNKKHDVKIALTSKPKHRAWLIFT